MKKIYLVIAIIFLMAGLSISVFAQKQKQSNKKRPTTVTVRRTESVSNNEKITIGDNRSSIGRKNQDIEVENDETHWRNNRQMQSNSVVFEPNNEPLWVRRKYLY